MVECADGFLDGGVTVWTVGIDEIEIFEVKTLEAAVHTFDDAFAREAVLVYGAVAVGLSPVDLKNQEMHQINIFPRI